MLELRLAVRGIWVLLPRQSSKQPTRLAHRRRGATTARLSRPRRAQVSSAPPLDLREPCAPRPRAADLVHEAARDGLHDLDAAGSVARQRVPPLLHERSGLGARLRLLRVQSAAGCRSRRHGWRNFGPPNKVVRVEEIIATTDADAEGHWTVEGQSACVAAGHAVESAWKKSAEAIRVCDAQL